MDIKSLKEALLCSPGNVPLLKLYGRSCLDAWMFEEAVSAFRKASQTAPGDLDSQLGLIQALHGKGDTSQAAVLVDELIKRAPQFAEAWVLASKIALAENNRAKAAEFLDEARRLSPRVKDKELDVEFPPGERAQPALNTSEWDAQPAAFTPDEDGSKAFMIPDNAVTNFDQVGGMDEVKEDIRKKVIFPYQNPEIFAAYGKKSGGGSLFYGPPGCGKTLMARATAGEIDVRFFTIGLHQVLDMYIGNSEKNLHDFFECGRKYAPCVLFIDEIDALAANRTDMRHSAGRSLINQFLSEFDGIMSSNEGVFVMGATNAPWHVDPAFLRPGRFDRVIFVPPPDEGARESILQIILKDKPVEKIDLKALVLKTKGFSGADLRAIVEMAMDDAMTAAAKQGRVVPVTTANLLAQVSKLTPSVKLWFESARNYAMFSNQSGFYDPILSYLGVKKNV